MNSVICSKKSTKIVHMFLVLKSAIKHWETIFINRVMEQINYNTYIMEHYAAS